MEFMFLKSRKDVVAVDIGSSAVKLVQLKQVKKGWELQKLSMAPLPPEAIVDGSIIDSMTVTNTVADIVRDSGVKIKEAVSALTGHSVIIRKVSLPAMTEEELAESIQWEAEQYIPFPMTDVNIDFQILGEGAAGTGQMDVTLVAVKKDVINDYVNVLKEAGLTPVVMDVDSFALENMVEVNYSFPQGENLAVVNIGASITSISMVVGGVTVFTRSTPSGGNQCTEELQRQLGISFKEAEDIKTGKAAPPNGALQELLASVINSTALEVKRTVDFFLGSVPGVMINRIMLCGGGSKLLGLKELVQERTAMPVELANPFSGLSFNPKNFNEEYLTSYAPHFGVAVGLATRRLGDR